MKNLLLLAVSLSCAFVQASHAQNVEGQIIASQYGTFSVPSVGNGFSFSPASCQIPAGGKNFPAFTAGVPVKIVDTNPAHTEVVTPVAAFITNSNCSVSLTPTFPHTSFYLTSGTGGLQEAINNGQVYGGANTIILDQQWYSLITPLSAATVIATVSGNTLLGIIDVTTTPYTGYAWNGSQYVSAGTGGAVSSVFGRTGTVAAVSGDYSVAQVTGAAPLASPTFTGTPTAPTQAISTNNTDIATTAAVTTALIPYAPLASPTFTGIVSTPALTLTGFTGTTCLEQVSGVVTSTGSACGSGGSGVSSVSNSDGTLTISPTTGAAIASLALGHANTWVALQTFGTNISFGGQTVTGATGTGGVSVFGASPTFTGTPAAPTAAANTNTTQLATTAYVVGQVGTATPLINGSAAVGTSLLYARQDHVHPTDTTRAPVASPTFTGTATTPALTLSGFTGTTCLEQISGVVTSTGSACGSGSSGISGLTANFIPLAGTSTTITGNSHMDDGVTTASTITSSEALAALTLATTGTGSSTIAMSGSSSGTVTLTVPAAAGTPTVTFGSSSGTPAVTVSAPLALNTTTGNLTVTGAAGQVLAGSTPAFTATPVLGASGTVGTLGLGNATSGTVTLGTVTGALGSVTASLPANTGTVAETNLAQSYSAVQTFPGGDLFQGGVNAQTGTTYTIVAGDENKLLTLSNAASVAVTLPVASTSGFGTGAVFSVFNKGAGTVTITPTTSTINGASTLSLTTGNGVDIWSDGTNYQIQQNASSGGGSLPTGTIGQTVYYAAGGTTGTATSAIAETSASTTGVIQFSGVESHFATGPTSATTINSSLATGGTTFTVVSTTGYPSCSTSVPCYLVLNSNNFGGEVASCTAIGSGTTFTGCVRSLFGTSASNPTPVGGSVDLIADLKADSTSGPIRYASIWGGGTFHNVLAGSLFQQGADLQAGPSSYDYYGTNGVYSNKIGFGPGFPGWNQLDNGIGIFNSGTTLVQETDGDGITANLDATLAVTSGTTTMAPVSGVVELTGTAPTALATMTPPSGSTCVRSGIACTIQLSGVGFTTTTGGNFQAIYTVAANALEICTYFQSASKWRCK